MVVILLISLAIALFTRWVLISTLTSELKQRGLGISYRIADSSRSYILTENIPELTSLIFDARIGTRKKKLVVYVFILDKEERILAHTFTRPFPRKIMRANLIESGQDNRISLLFLGNSEVYDVAVPVNEGIYRIGSVHVGLNKNHIDNLIRNLRTMFLGFLSAVTILFFVISHRLSRYITQPITELTKVSDEISRGNFDIQLAPDQAGERGHVKDEVRQLSNSFINMTNRIKESQAKLTESESKYRSLFTSGPNPIFVLDRRSLTILSANPSAEETYGYQQGELIGRSFITTLGPFEPDPGVFADAGEEDKSSVRTAGSKVRYQKKNGEVLYVNVHASPTRFQDKDAWIVATTDITEMVEKDSQLIQASKMTTLGEMSAGIAHEINQPLNAIKMGSEFLEMMIEKNERIPEADLMQVVGEVSRQVDRAETIIRRLRDFGRKADFSKEKVMINDPVTSVLDIIGRQLQLQNIDIRLEMGKHLPPILAHHNRIEQVIFNLLTNARDAINLKEDVGISNGKREIVIKSYLQADRVMITVSDTGIGIDLPIKKRIFEAFFTTKKMGEGMGLGLSITNGIVKDYGGTIDIESTKLKGTRFILSFPAANE